MVCVSFSVLLCVFLGPYSDIENNTYTARNCIFQKIQFKNERFAKRIFPSIASALLRMLKKRADRGQIYSIYFANRPPPPLIRP